MKERWKYLYKEFELEIPFAILIFLLGVCIWNWYVLLGIYLALTYLVVLCWIMKGKLVSLCRLGSVALFVMFLISPVFLPLSLLFSPWMDLEYYDKPRSKLW